ncbi:4-alpha-glucanotransferase [Enhydrobacter aerosaccus]|uniref:4-alpha-glucanotransferase n=1 Tax=Enhydrobacter aerosaccus TaxID=225324 RepID=A0A1T4SQM9_9HYPH|nr:4-alpha-glucanotransferase [Enhydrobacter aerosaccus]SKA30492.1 4-alpha-glucanotransferase [Enhydrobacter aerosaccus]
MNDEAVRTLAQQVGLAVDWIDAADQPQRVSVPSLLRLLEALGYACCRDADLRDSARRAEQARAHPPLVTTTVGLPTRLDVDADLSAELLLEDGWRQALTIRHGLLSPIGTPGYHRLRYGQREITLAVAPPRCVTVSDIAPGRKLWGLGVQLYSLRREGDGGIGDTTALRDLGKSAAARGASAIAVSPTHSLFPADVGRYGPYSPSNRLFLNPLLADPADALGAKWVEARRLPATPDRLLIDWPQDGGAKYAWLRRLYDDFVINDIRPRTTLASGFHLFVQAGGPALQKHAVCEAEASGDGTPLDYFLFLQWIAEESFARAQADLRAAGMAIGLIGDLAIGLDRGGSQVGADPEHFLGGVSIGAPPDLFNPKGQGWGLTSFSPQSLVSTGFEPFIATVRAALRHAGGLRIDHAMGLKRLWLVPDGCEPGEGAYLSYPMDDLLRLLALESHRHRALIIGEDLGTVPPDFRERCRAAGIGGMDVLWFEREGDGFLPASRWRDDAVAMTSTHDLPTVAGWWRGADLELRRGLGTASQDDVEQRSRDRTALWHSFTEAKVAEGPPPAADRTEPVVDAAIAFTAVTPDPLALIPLEDMLGTVEQPNLPGTIDEHPNWRRRFAEPAATLLDAPAAARRVSLLNKARQ